MLTRKVPLKIAIAEHPHTSAIRNGSIPIEGVDAEFITVQPQIGAFRRMVRDVEFDVCELAPTTWKPGLARVHGQGDRLRAEPPTGERARAQCRRRSVGAICACSRSRRGSRVHLSLRPCDSRIAGRRHGWSASIRRPAWQRPSSYRVWSGWVLRWDAANARLTLVQSLPVSNAAFQGVKSGAEIAISQDGRFVYVENRGENELVVYRVNPESGMLSLIQRTSSGGNKPWGFAIHPSGKWLLVANQRSGKVNVFSIDTATGMVSDTGESVDMPTPVSVAFVE